VRIGRRVGGTLARLCIGHRRNNVGVAKVRQVLSWDPGRYFAGDVAERKELLSSQITKTELEFVHSDVFNFKPSDSRFDLVLCLGLIAHVGRLDILLAHLKSMLTSNGRIILQTTLTDHVGARIVRALTTRRELARRGYPISWFSQRDIANACHVAGLRIVEIRRHSLGIPFGDRFSPWANFQLETHLQKWASRHGADAIYLLERNCAGEK